MIAPHRIHGTDDRMCVKHMKRLKGDAECPLCPRAPMDAAVVSSGRNRSAPRPAASGGKRPKAGSDVEALLASQLAAAGYFDATEDERAVGRVTFRRQHPWGLALVPERGFTADVAFLGQRLLCEVKGMAHAAGRKKVRADVEREGLAVSLGWTVLPLTPESVRDGSAVALIARALQAAKGGGE